MGTCGSGVSEAPELTNIATIGIAGGSGFKGCGHG